MREKKHPGDATPDVHSFVGSGESRFALLNQFGTYNIQPTADTENIFPLIGPALPKQWQDMSIDKYDLEEQ